MEKWKCDMGSRCGTSRMFLECLGNNVHVSKWKKQKGKRVKKSGIKNGNKSGHKNGHKIGHKMGE